MTSTSATTSARPSTAGSGLLRAFQVFALLAALNVLFQFVTAGQLFGRGEGPEGAHSAGAIVLHVFSGLAAVAAVLLWRQGGISLRLMVLAVVVFGYTFLQAATGGRSSLYVHVPGAMLMTAGVVWLLVAAVRVRRA